MKRKQLFLLLAVITLGYSRPAFTQSLEWAKTMGSTRFDEGYAIATDGAGNVYVTGIFERTVDFDPGPGTVEMSSFNNSRDVFVCKFNAGGNLLWARQLGGTQWDEGRGIEVDGSGNVYITGFFEGTADFDPGAGTFNLTSAGNRDVFVCKLNSSGGFLWAKQFSGTDQDQGTSLAIDGSGNVVIAGSFRNTVDFDPGPAAFNLTSGGISDLFVCKLTSNGSFAWAIRVGGTYAEWASAVKMDQAGNVYAAGWFAGAADFDPGAGTSMMDVKGSRDAFVLKLNATGNFVWARQMGGSGAAVEATSLVLEGNNNVYITGFFSGAADFDPGAGTSTLSAAGATDAFVMRLDASGNFGWARKIGGSGSDRGCSVTVDPQGSLFVTGYFQSTVDFDPGAGTRNLSSAGGLDIFILKLSSAGNFSWAGRMGGAEDDEGFAITSDGAGNIYSTGYFNGTADLDPNNGISQYSTKGREDIYIHKMNPQVTSTKELPIDTRITLAPNPAGTETLVTFERVLADVTITIYSISGQQVASLRPGTTDRVLLQTEDLASGTYIVRIRSEDKASSVKLVRL